MMSSPWIIEVMNGALMFEEIQGGGPKQKADDLPGAAFILLV
jgi:hypothetical protein